MRLRGGYVVRRHVFSRLHVFFACYFAEPYESQATLLPLKQRLDGYCPPPPVIATGRPLNESSPVNSFSEIYDMIYDIIRSWRRDTSLCVTADTIGA